VGAGERAEKPIWSSLDELCNDIVDIDRTKKLLVDIQTGCELSGSYRCAICGHLVEDAHGDDSAQCGIVSYL
jgi:hypothetical protein